MDYCQICTSDTLLFSGAKERKILDKLCLEQEIGRKELRFSSFPPFLFRQPRSLIAHKDDDAHLPNLFFSFLKPLCGSVLPLFATTEVGEGGNEITLRSNEKDLCSR